MNKFKQLNLKEREVIRNMLREKKSLREIARALGRNVSTISRELKNHRKGKNKIYLPELIQKRVTSIRQVRGSRPRLKNAIIRNYVEEKLKLGWSPEQISGRLPQDNPGLTISYEAIYQYIYARCQREGWGPKCLGEDLRVYLRRKRKRRKRKYTPHKAPKQGVIHNRVGIESRPKYIEKRKQVGHWEGDSIESRESREKLNSLVERVSGLVFISKLKDGTSLETTKAVLARFSELPKQLRRSLTLDNGKENAKHETITSKSGTKVYFCNPYSSWERGSNENTNGLIRGYLPKKTDFAKVSEKRIQEIEHLLNSRPRKRLNYLTPLEVFSKSVAFRG
jgi:transposase, IS30 family